MPSPFKPTDHNGNPLAKGNLVFFNKAPEALLHGLPQKDKKAIQDQEGKILKIMGFDKYGHVELEFTDLDGDLHTIWVQPKYLCKSG